MTCKTLRCCTYNCRGWGSGSNYVSILLKAYDLIFIQEHWLLPDHLGALNISDDFISVGVSGIDTCNSELLVGRPFGGCGILIRKSLASNVRRLRNCSKRFCAIILTLTNPITNSSFNTLLLSVYLPTDYGTSDSRNSFSESLAELEGFVSSHPYDNLIICGDFNVDFCRGGHNCSSLISFMHDFNLVRTDVNPNINYTYRRDDHTSFPSDLDLVCTQLLDCLAVGANLCLPKSRSKSSAVPGWNIQAHSLRQSANFWHKLWCDCGCPTSGVLFQIKKKTKKRYKYEVRRLKRQREYIKCEKMGEALSYSRQRDFWKEVRKLSNSVIGRRTNVPVIDGLSNDVEIADLFSSKLKHILNSGCSSSARSDLVSFLNSSLCVSDLEFTTISSATVSAALSQLKLGKSEGTNLLSNHFICASPVLKEFLCNIFTAMLRNGYVPNSLRDCILQPIPKPGKDPSNSDNYRPIALAHTLGKVFEVCILNEYRSAFATSTLQFGFKQGFSTDLCTGLIKNVMTMWTTQYSLRNCCNGIYLLCL